MRGLPATVWLGQSSAPAMGSRRADSPSRRPQPPRHRPRVRAAPASPSPLERAHGFPLVRGRWTLPSHTTTAHSGLVVHGDGVGRICHVPHGDERAVREGVVGAAEIAITTAGAPLLWHWFNHWGATPEEVTAPMPGDDLVPSPKLGYTLRVAGEPRRLRHAQRGPPSCGAPAPGTGCLVRLGPPGYPCFSVIVADPPTTLVLMGTDPPHREDSDC